MFEQNVRNLKDQVINKAGIDGADFLKKYPLSTFTHEQYPPKNHKFEHKSKVDQSAVSMKGSPMKGEAEEEKFFDEDVDPKENIVHSTFFGRQVAKRRPPFASKGGRLD